jgi:hypothetical protein
VKAAQSNFHPADSKRQLAVTGVMLVIFLFAIDATIVSTAMPTIVAKLGGLELFDLHAHLRAHDSALRQAFGPL